MKIHDDNQSTKSLWYELVDLGATLQYFSAYFFNNPRKWFSLQYNTRDEKQLQQKHIRFKNANLKKDAVSSIYPRFLTYRSYLSVTEKFNTYGVSFPQASFFQK